MNFPFPPPDKIPQGDAPVGRFDARYLAFLETITTLRPSLHRYCARMTGSALDGEDVVQETLFQAYRKLDTFDETRPLKPWLFRIAYNRCIDLLRRRGSREKAEALAAADDDDWVAPTVPVGPALGKAVEHLVLILPPKERACVLLKDVFDHSLEEIAELVDSTVGGVKAALHRGRSKLLERPIQQTAGDRERSEAEAALLRLYIDRFNQRDWVGVRDLIAADAQLLVADRFAALIKDSPYFGTYERMPETWRLVGAEIDGETALVIQVAHPSTSENRDDRIPVAAWSDEANAASAQWESRAAVRLRISHGKIVEITDYWFCPWVIPGAGAVRLG